MAGFWWAGAYEAAGGAVPTYLARLHADGTFDTSFDPNASSNVLALALQADGRILAAGDLTAMGGETRNRIARLAHDIPALSSLTVTGTSQIDWTRGNSAPETSQAAFERWNGSAWTLLGNATRVADGWRLAGLSLPASGWIRARGRTSGGWQNGSGGLIEQILAYGSPDAPDIGVATADGSNLAYGSAVLDFGDQPWPASSPLLQTLTITNSGTATLSGLAIALKGDNMGDFATGSLPATTLAPGAALSLAVTFSAKGAGLRRALLSIASNDPDEPSFEITLGGTLVQADPAFNPDANADVDSLALQADGKILVAGRFNTLGGAARNYLARLNQTGAPDDSFDPNPNSAVRPLAIQEDGGILIGSGFTFAGGAARNHIARLLNDIPATSTLAVAGAAQVDWTRGGSAPEIGQVTFDIRNGDEWLSLGHATRAAGGWRLTGLSLPAAGQVRARGRTSNGTDTGLVEETATYAFPDIAIEAPAGTDLTTGSAYDFGAVLTGATAPATVSVKNAGAVALDLGAITLTGDHVAEFALSTTGMAASLAPVEQTSLQVTFAPTSGGAKTAALSIASNDPDENPFTLTLTGTGNNAPAFPGYTLATPYQIPAVIPFRKLITKASDPDGDTLTVSAADATSAHGGSVTLLADAIRYTLPNGFSGADTFSVTVTDEGGASVTGTVTVQVGQGPFAGAAGNNPPILTVLPGGKEGLSFQGIPGRAYTVQRSVAGLDDWEILATITADAAGKVSITDDNPPPGSAFYRLGIPVS